MLKMAMARAFLLLFFLVAAGCEALSSNDQMMESKSTPTASTLDKTIVSETKNSAVPTSAVTTNATELLTIHMIDPSIGWAVSKQGILRTTDSGADWRLVLKVAFSDLNPRFTPFYFLDAAHAWVADNLLGGTLYMTSDGGTTWGETESIGSVKNLSFIDAKNGWRMSFVDAATGGQELVEIYQTTDGGFQWQRVAATFPNKQLDNFPMEGVKTGMTFLHSGIGWAAGGLTNVEGYTWLYETKDRGHHWVRHELSIREADKDSLLVTHTPIYFNEQQGILPIFSNKTDVEQERFHLEFFLTTDAGKTWVGSAPLECNNTSPVFFYDFINVNQGWVVTNGKLFSTEDSGKHWTLIEPVGGLENNISSIIGIDFVNENIGWALTDSSALYRTLDGGATWTLLNKLEK
jgi:photosystem II stability/assembly factor-like uncharacterized protein